MACTFMTLPWLPPLPSVFYLNTHTQQWSQPWAGTCESVSQKNLYFRDLLQQGNGNQHN